MCTLKDDLQICQPLRERKDRTKKLKKRICELLTKHEEGVMYGDIYRIFNVSRSNKILRKRIIENVDDLISNDFPPYGRIERIDHKYYLKPSKSE